MYGEDEKKKLLARAVAESSCAHPLSLGAECDIGGWGSQGINNAVECEQKTKTQTKT
jgi:hypothetical protein